LIHVTEVASESARANASVTEAGSDDRRASHAAPIQFSRRTNVSDQLPAKSGLRQLQSGCFRQPIFCALQEGNDYFRIAGNSPGSCKRQSTSAIFRELVDVVGSIRLHLHINQGFV